MWIESALLALVVLIINMPFGYWREGVSKFSGKWFLAVHAAVPIIILIRYVAGIEWRLAALPLTVFAYFFGQYLGARIRRRQAIADE
jgi:F0F1-type ATP synthase membrane subunit a